MGTESFKAKAYVKEGCPFSFKFLVFMTEAGLLDRIDVVRMSPDDPSFVATKSRLTEHLGQPATFPTVEVEPGHYMTDSDRLIDYYAQRLHRQPGELPVLSFYKQTILPKLIELHRLKTRRG